MVIDIKNFLLENKSVDKIVVNQFFGLGDILFIEPIYRYLHDLGLEVIAPVQDDYIWISDNIKYVKFKKMSEFNIDYEKFEFGLLSENMAYLPIRFSDQIFRNLPPHDVSASRYWMSDKYRVLGLDVKKWLDIKISRDLKKENMLKEIILDGITEYDFCNSLYQNSKDIDLKLEDIVKTDLPVISMRKIEGFGMVDWCGIIENARKVHTVSTSLIYMIQSIYTNNKEYHIYPRGADANLYTVEDFLPDYWIKH
jgi:hypothetical protein